MNLDLDSLRMLVTAVDLGGYGQAGARLGRTPSAVSLQMKRLQTAVGAPLFRKSGRGVALTEAGEIVLRYARRMLAMNDELLDTVRGAALSGAIRLGCSQDFAESILPAVLSRFSELYPLVLVELRIEGNAVMAEAVAKGELDIALAVGQADHPLAECVGELDLVWIAGKAFAPRPDQPLPLVLLGQQCAFRKTAIAALDRRDVPWRLAALSPSLAGLWASALGGLGITARSRMNLPAGLVQGESLFGLPALGHFPITLHMRPDSGKAVTRSRDFIVEAIASMPSE